MMHTLFVVRSIDFGDFLAVLLARCALLLCVYVLFGIRDVRDRLLSIVFELQVHRVESVSTEKAEFSLAFVLLCRFSQGEGLS